MRFYFLIVFILITISSSKLTARDQTEFYNQFTLFPLSFGVESGYVSQEYDNGVGHTFYQLIYKVGTDKDTQTNTDPLVISLMGGPGCSTQSEIFEEVGPFSLIKQEEKYKILIRKTSWNNFAHQLFVDQPFGTGFSYTNSSQVTNTVQAAAHFSEFLYQFYTEHPKLLQNPLSIFGISYAGHYIPTFSAEILKNPKLRTLNINFQGIGIGDGWTNPLYQFTAYSSFLYSIGVVDNYRRDLTEGLTSQAQTDILQNNYKDSRSMFDEEVGKLLVQYTGNMSPYNFQNYNDNFNSAYYIDFLNQNKGQLGVPEELLYLDCNPEVYKQFTDLTQSVESDLVYVINQGKQVLLFNGQLDYMVNTAGVLTWLNEMNWNNSDKWKNQEKKFLKVNGENVGWYKKADNFTFVNIYKAGHMAVGDQPDATYAMFQHYILNNWE